MPPIKMSLTQFNRIINVARRFLSSVDQNIKELEDLPPTQAVAQAKFIESSLKIELTDFNDNITPYMNTDSLCEGLSEEVLEEMVSTIRTKFFELSCQVAKHLTQPQPAAHSTHLPATYDSTFNNSSSITLPKLRLNKFSGDYAEFESFYARFDTLVNGNNNLSSCEKFEYLLGHLEGTALDVIKHLPFVESSYASALKLLKNRFSNRRRVTGFHANSILALPYLTNSVQAIRSFLDQHQVHFASLDNSLGNETDVHVQDIIYVQYVLSKFSSDLRDEFERESAKLDFISLDQVLDFLNRHVKALENATLGTSGIVKSSNFHHNSLPNQRFQRKDIKKQSKGKSFSALSVCHEVCVICSSPDHKIFCCDDFTNRVPKERFKLIKSKGLCVRCLMAKHPGACIAANGCHNCKSKSHHSLLHFNEETKDSEPATPLPALQCNVTVQTPPSRVCVLMATALVRLQVSPTQFVIARAVLDSASHVSFVSEHIAQTLKCVRMANDGTTISGIGQSTTYPSGQCVLSICTVVGKSVMPNHQFFILPNISANTPREYVSPAVLEAAKCFCLADPTFHVPSRVDVLLGADILAASLVGPVTSLGKGLPVVMFTAFGAVLCGSASVAPIGNKGSCVATACVPGDEPCSTPMVSLMTSSDKDLVECVHKFWSVEEPPNVKRRSPEEVLCEKHFNDTTIRLDSGRYQVRLPFQENGDMLLGNTRGVAMSRLQSLERKFKSDAHFHNLYVLFMRDYINRGHMTEITDPSFPRYFIPHHGVYKTHGDKDKIRVVFDASAKSSSSLSLNSVLLDTPNVMTLLSDILTLFRVHLFAFTCDVEQMYRQIIMHKDDRRFQCILWRESNSLPVKTYALCTLTYGVGPSAYQAISTIRKLADDESHRFPKAAAVLLKRIFVDDIGAGENKMELALQLRDELISLLSAGGFTLKKWSSNAPELLVGIPPDACLPPTSSSVLGLVWDHDNDTLKFAVDEMSSRDERTLTKRLVLSQTAKLYDPCGYISPVVIYAKCFFQRLWRLPLDWDTPIPPELVREWKEFQCSLSDISNFYLSRPLSVNTSVQLHAFCDASLSGLAAVLYLRSEHDGCVMVNLLASKTKVAPLRPLSIPRLELLSAHLLARLVKHYLELLSPEMVVEGTFLWSDSTIVLDWLNMAPYLLKTFVANRVADISDWTEIKLWRHVPGILNPADVASRGLKRFSNDDVTTWTKGPPFLYMSASNWPSRSYESSHTSADLELKAAPVVLYSDVDRRNLFVDISSWSKVIRVATHIARWRHFSKPQGISDVEMRKLGLNLVIRHVQLSCFPEDIYAISQGKCAKPAIQRLAPFIDTNGVVRIKGRLTNMSCERPSPILLPKNHHVVNLLIEHYHKWLGHAGPSQVQFQLSWTYWILSARQIIRKVIHRCMKCFRAKPRGNFPLMGDLPAVRVNPSPPFWNTGMDFCGPFMVKPYALRKSPLVKAYLCIFICMSTKCVHLEVAHDMSAQSFLDILKRFIARRGIPFSLFSDCGTNFMGTRTALQRELRSLLNEHSDNAIIKNYLLDNDINFKTIPPSAPHQGGLWERAVQSAKYHLKRIVGGQTLVLSQLITLATLIEAIINSRPLTPMSTDAGDFTALTPAHFLIGRPLTMPPEEDVTEVPDGSLLHHHLIRAMMQRFWSQWRTEYLTTLQARAKWTRSTPNLRVGDLVVLSEPNCPPLLWPLGRVSGVHPGKDGIVRRVSVATKDGEYDRPAVKVFRLPMEEVKSFNN